MTRINNFCGAGRGVVCAFAALALCSCTVRIGDLTLISTKNIDLSDARLNVKEGKRVKGDDCVYSILGLIPLGIPNLERAVDDALEKGQGNVMVDQVSSISNIYFVIASQSCIKVEGTVLNAAEGPAPAPRT